MASVGCIVRPFNLLIKDDLSFIFRGRATCEGGGPWPPKIFEIFFLLYRNI